MTKRSNATEGAFLLGDLLAHPEFKTQLLTGAEQGLLRPVAGAHAMETENPSSWVPRDWIMLTTGIRLRGRADAQRALVRDLSEGGMAALGYSTGVATKNVPPAMVEEGERLGFPIFSIPFEIPLRSVVTFVQRVVLAEDPEVVRRVMATQDYLLDVAGSADLGVGQQAPESLILTRLSSLLRLGVAILDVDGTPLFAEGFVEPKDLSKLLRRVPSTAPSEVSTSTGRLLVLPIRSGERTTGWLAVSLPRAGDAKPTTMVVAQSAARLLGLVTMSRESGPQRREILGAQLLAQALQESATGEDSLEAPRGQDDLEIRARDLGISFSEPAFALVIPGDRDVAPEPWRYVVRAFNETKAPYLVLKNRTEWIVLMQGNEDQVYDFATSLGRLVGIGRPVNGVRAFRRSVADARFALVRHRSDRAKSLVARFTSLPLAHWLIGTASGGDFEEMCERVLAPLTDQQLLLEAVIAYLAAEQDILRAANSLHLHPNSLRYRLSKVEERIGAPLRRPETVLSLYAALSARGYV
ncbi:PucR family transcriptional regulator [Planosporangium flavigriseum]|uniref:PucR family transcriptional regulator n=1 Tax=Planosporangium flavigriseum TaxID=373681 RepID=A0A8J3LTS6_9ACTN|nr:PucR family transcriptional regulator ligand-binding domain-containing protein [Planosporangium flavigriseum]NJC62994.1 PucR family transcriptional regulator [Planosporangium flavigriseum]GIG73135.1 hypothetical protein Pfl04_15390 [Planosporangium flavigriseum]